MLPLQRQIQVRTLNDQISETDKTILSKYSIEYKNKYGFDYESKYTPDMIGFLKQYDAIKQRIKPTIGNLTKIKDVIGEIALRTIVRAKTAASSVDTTDPNPFSIFDPILICEQNKHILEEINRIPHLDFDINVDSIDCYGEYSSINDPNKLIKNSNDQLSIETLLDNIYLLSHTDPTERLKIMLDTIYRLKHSENTKQELIDMLNEIYDIISRAPLTARLHVAMPPRTRRSGGGAGAIISKRNRQKMKQKF